MIESAIIALREGVEIALVIGILIVYLRKARQTALIPAVYAGLGGAVLASIGGAVILLKLGIDSESLEGTFMLFAAVFVLSMVIWMWRTAKHIKHEIEEKVGAIITKEISWKARLGIFSFTFFMIVREGIETAIFLQAVALSEGAWKSIAGTLAGVALAIVFGVMFVRGSVRIDIGKFLRVTALTLIVFTLQLLVNAVHEFYEFGILPASPKMMGILGPIVQHDALFMAAIFFIPAFMLLLPGRKKVSASEDNLGNEPATARKERARRGWQVAAGLATICITLFLGVGSLFSTGPTVDLTADMLSTPPDGMIRIPTASVSDGNIHRFSIKDSSVAIRFFVLKTHGGKIATCFDACRACYAYGRYYVKGDELICSQCDAPVEMAKLRTSRDEADSTDAGSEENPMSGSGCVPMPLASKIEHGNVVIQVADLRLDRKYFDIPDAGK